MDPQTLAQLSAEERAFLHDLATPLATMTLILDVLGESTQAKLNETELQKLQQLKKLVERFIPSLSIVSANEIAPFARVKSIATVGT